MEGEVYTEEQVAELLAHTATIPDEKTNAHSFLKKVVETEDTTKVGYLREEEVGIPKLSMRTLKELELYCGDIADEDKWKDYFKKRAEILVSTSLSKDAKLIDLAILQRKEVGTIPGRTSQRKANKGWFRRKNTSSDQV